MLNGSAAALIAFYLLTVLYSDKQDALLKAVREEVGFLKWSGALLMLYYLYKFAGGNVGEIVQQLTLLALVALLLNKGETTFKQVSDMVSGESDKKESSSLDWESPSMQYAKDFIYKG